MPSRLFLYSICTALFLYSWASVNIYLPILPELEHILHTTPHLARLTVTIFLIGYAFTQIIWGPLSDRFGRRPMLLSGLACSCLGAALAATSNDIYTFIAARLLESIGLGVAPALARSVLTDTLSRSYVAIAMAYGAIASAVMPAIAPVIGGNVDYFFSWRAIFVLLAMYGGLLFLCVLFRLPETNRHIDPSHGFRSTVASYKEMLSNPRFVGHLSIYGIGYGGVFGYYAAAPFIFTVDLGYTARDYGLLLLINIAAYMFGAWLARIIIPRQGIDRVIVYTMITFVATSVLFLVLEFVTTLNTVSVLLPMSVYIFATGLVSPAANTGAMTAFKAKAGSASSLAGFAVAAGGAAVSGVLAGLHITRLWHLALYIGICALLCIGCYLALLRRHPDDAEDQE